MVESLQQEMQVVVFRLLGEEFAAPIQQVREVIRLPQLTRMPRSPQYVAGLLNLRGKVFPVVDLKRRFKMAEQAHNANTRIMVVEVEDQTMGFVVDEVREVLRLPKASVEPAPALIAEATGQYLRGVAKAGERLILLLDLDMLFSNEELEEMQQGLAESPGPGEGL